MRVVPSTVCTTTLKEAEFLPHGATILALKFSATVLFHEKGEKYISVS